MLAAILAASACGDETLRAYGAAGKIWSLSELDGKPFTASATLTFPHPGQIAGQAPCNSYSGEMTAPYPWFEATAIATTRKACPGLGAETAFFAALGAMTQAETLADTLLLSTEDGRTMLFTAAG